MTRKRTCAAVACLIVAGCATMQQSETPNPPEGPWRMVIIPAFDPGSGPAATWLREADIAEGRGDIRRVWTLNASAESYWLSDYDCRTLSRVRAVANLKKSDEGWLREDGDMQWNGIIPHTPPRWTIDHVCGLAEASVIAADPAAARREEDVLKARRNDAR